MFSSLGVSVSRCLGVSVCIGANHVEILSISCWGNKLFRVFVEDKSIGGRVRGSAPKGAWKTQVPPSTVTLPSGTARGPCGQRTKSAPSAASRSKGRCCGRFRKDTSRQHGTPTPAPTPAPPPAPPPTTHPTRPAKQRNYWSPRRSLANTHSLSMGWSWTFRVPRTWNLMNATLSNWTHSRVPTLSNQRKRP